MCLCVCVDEGESYRFLRAQLLFKTLCEKSSHIDTIRLCVQKSSYINTISEQEFLYAQGASVPPFIHLYHASLLDMVLVYNELLQ